MINEVERPQERKVVIRKKKMTIARLGELRILWRVPQGRWRNQEDDENKIERNTEYGFHLVDIQNNISCWPREKDETKTGVMLRQTINTLGPRQSNTCQMNNYVGKLSLRV